MFCTFWLGNVLRATAACTFSFLIWPHGSAPAASASLLFDPPDPQIIRKTQCFATFLTFPAPASSFFWLFLFLSFILLSSTSLLCFSSLHIVGSLTSKLPLMTKTIVVSKYWCCFYYYYCCTISDTATVLYYSYYLHYCLCYYYYH